MTTLLKIVLCICMLWLAGRVDCMAQKIRPEIEDLAYLIAEEGTIIDNGGSEYFENLCDWSRDEELVELTDHKKSVVRCYSFLALLSRSKQDILSIVKKHLHDTAEVGIDTPCLSYNQTVRDYFITELYSKITSNSHKLTDQQLSEFDSLMVFGAIDNNPIRNEVLIRVSPDMKYYNFIREMVTVQKNNEILIALAKYQNQNDTSIIIERLNSTIRENRYYGLCAARYFPDSSFFPYIAEIHSSEINPQLYPHTNYLKVLYLTIVQYKIKAARDLLQMTIDKAEKSKHLPYSQIVSHSFEFQTQWIWLALEKYPDDVFDDFQDKIQLSRLQKGSVEIELRYPDETLYGKWFPR
jgi:hypothetical protein